MDKTIVLGIALVILCGAVLPVTGQLPHKAGDNQQKNMEQQSAGGREADLWPMFRHDSGNTGYTTTDSPQMNHLAWKQQIGSETSSTPILSGNNLYLSTGWYYKQRAKSVPLETTPRTIIESLKDYLKTLTQYDPAAGVYCLNAQTGAQLWFHPMVGALDPALVNDRLYLADTDLYSYTSDLNCLDAQTGNVVWQKQLNQFALSPTIVADNKIYVGSLDIYTFQGAFRCFDLNGNQLWNYVLPPYEAMWYSAPAVSGGYAYFLTFNLYFGGGHLFCLNAATGQFLWSQPIFSMIPYYYFFQGISPVCSQGKVFAVDLDLYGYYGYLKCFNGATGSLLWVYATTPNLPVSPPAVTNDSVFLLTSDLSGSSGQLCALYSANGTVHWTNPITGTTYMVMGSPVCSAKNVILNLQFTNLLGSFDQQTGALNWEYTLDNETLGSASIGNGWLYISDYKGTVYAFQDAVAIQTVAGGFLGVHAKIQNIGSAIATNVSWSIAVTGGAFGQIDRSKSGTIKEIPLGESTTVRLMPLIGIGSIKIVVSVHLPNTNSIQTVKNGRILGFLTLVTP